MQAGKQSQVFKGMNITGHPPCHSLFLGCYAPIPPAHKKKTASGLGVGGGCLRLNQICAERFSRKIPEKTWETSGKKWNDINKLCFKANLMNSPNGRYVDGEYMVA